MVNNKFKKGCLFCKIISGKIPSVKIWENKKYLAILDSYPNTEGMTLILTKSHYDSEITSLSEKDYREFMSVIQIVAKILERGLKVKRVAVVIEGMGINHAHIKIYPLHGLNKTFKEIWPKKRAYFRKYKGWLSTQLGPRKTKEQLEKVARKIRRRIKSG